MSDYNFLKSGSGSGNMSDDGRLKIESLIMLFAENAMKSAAEYVEHAERTIIQVEDLQKAMKVEAMMFCQKSSIIQQANELLQDVLENQEEYENDDLSDLITNDEETYTLSKCKCNLCQVVNNTDNLWENWIATTPIEKALKKNLNAFN